MTWKNFPAHTLIRRFAPEGSVPVVELSDEKGIYAIEVEKQGDAPGTMTRFQYVRAGKHDGGYYSDHTKINSADYEDGQCVMGESIAKLDMETGEWLKDRFS
jgi:hypothetical protein